MSDVTYVRLLGASLRPTLGLYAGMTPQELQRLVHISLPKREGVCAGFQVLVDAPQGRRKRLVPLSVACHDPEVLTGRVSALFVPSQDVQDIKLDVSRPKPMETTENARNNQVQTTKKLVMDPLKLKTKNLTRERVAPSSPMSIVQSLHAQRMLTSLELDILQALVAQKDSQVLHLLSKFQHEYRDSIQLRNELVAIVEEITTELGDEEKVAATAFAHGVHDAIRDDTQEGDSDEDSLGWQRHLIFLLGQWQAQHYLTLSDAILLHRMVAQRHNLLESAYEVFAGDSDATELLDTLQRIAKLQGQIEQTQGQAADSERKLSLENVVHEMQERGVIESDDATGLLALFHDSNEALQAANEAFQADGDVHELEETLLLVVKHMRSGNTETKPFEDCQTVARLLADFGRNSRLELWQIQLLMTLVKSQDPRLFAAIDVYNEDNNVDELVDTLEILVEQVAWERHRHVMVHNWIAPLAKIGKLPPGGAERLIELLNNRDDRVVAALVVFLSDNNKDEFVDTLARIACLETIKFQHMDLKLKQRLSILNLLKELEDTGVISCQERQVVESLTNSEEPRIVAAMNELVLTRNSEEFAQIVRRLLKDVREEGTALDALKEDEGEGDKENLLEGPKENESPLRSVDRSTDEDEEKRQLEMPQDVEHRAKLEEDDHVSDMKDEAEES